jgi:ubiquinone/menaquinone biosynthesis C-methylase UbiE
MAPMQPSRAHQLRLQRERQEHDAIAASLDYARMGVEDAGPLEAAIFAAADIEPGTRVLDLGCGSGDLSLQLLARGARVTGVDLSPGMIEVARKRAKLHFPEAEAVFIAAPVEDLALPPASFDAIVGRFILHHIELDVGAAQIAMLLAPGGRASFAENSARNPLLMFARAHVVGRFGVVRLGTADERPLSRNDVRRFSRHFSRTTVTYPVFDFFRIFDRQLLRFRRPTLSRLCNRLDQFVEQRLAWAHSYSFRVIVTTAK